MACVTEVSCIGNEEDLLLWGLRWEALLLSRLNSLAISSISSLACPWGLEDLCPLLLWPVVAAPTPFSPYKNSHS